MSGQTFLPLGLMTDPFKDYVRRATKSLVNHFLDMGVPTDDILPAMDEELDFFETVVFDVIKDAG